MEKYIGDITISEFITECKQHEYFEPPNYRVPENDQEGSCCTECPFDVFCDQLGFHPNMDLTKIGKISLSKRIR